MRRGSRGLECERHARLLRKPIALPQVARAAGRDDVLPVRVPAATPRHDVVERQLSPAEPQYWQRQPSRALFARDGWRCQYCGSAGKLTLDTSCRGVAAGTRTGRTSSRPAARATCGRAIGFRRRRACRSTPSPGPRLLPSSSRCRRRRSPIAGSRTSRASAPPRRRVAAGAARELSRPRASLTCDNSKSNEEVRR